jgi:sugar diacid utilization regulator
MVSVGKARPAEMTSTPTWLRLLLANADAEALVAHRDSQLGGTVDELTRSQIEAEANLAEELRTQLSEHRGRVSELAALYELALRLSGVQDKHTVLQDSVTQASRLLRVDVAYLALVEDDGSLTIRVTEGSLGPLLRGVSLLPNSGLAGRVVETGQLVESTDYLGDEALTHMEAADRIAHAEGLRTILGVPMVVRGEVIGILMVAQRKVRSFTPGERSLLSSFAALAALAIDTTRLMADYRQAVDDVSEANLALRQNVESVNRASQLHDDLLNIALRGDGVDQVVLSLSEVVAGVIAFIDQGDRLVCAAEGGSACSGTAALELAQGTPSALFAEAPRRRTWIESGGVVVPVASADSYFGALGVRLDGALSDIDVRMLERAAMTIALVASSERAVSDADRRSTTELLEQLVTGQVGDETSFARRARGLGLDVRQEHLVLVIDPPAEGADAALLRVRDLVAAHGGLTGRLLGHLVAVVRCQAEEVRTLATQGPALGTVGFAGPASGLANLGSAYEDALACLSVLHGLDRAGSCATTSDLGPFRFLLSRSAQSDAQRFVRATIGSLIEHDTDRGSELVTTASTFLGLGRQHAATAKALHVHANTLYQRLDRIGALLGEEWRVGDRALDVHMALRIHLLSARFGEIERP